MPLALRDYLLATGERGIGWSVVYGDAPLTVEQYELLTWMQQRVALASTEEGRKTLGQERRLDDALAFEAAAAAATSVAASVEPGTPGPPAVIARAAPVPPFDPETMDAAQVADWLARYGGVRH